MPNRVEELASMRAPNQSGVDSSAVIRALAGNPEVVGTPTTYAYGMKVEDAQKEAQLGAQNQARRESAIQDARNAAMEQDRQQFDMAMKAHAQYMAERNLALSERVANAEIALKNARMRGIPDEIRRVQLENQKLLGDIEREKRIDDLYYDIPSPTDPTKTTRVPARVLMTTGGRYLMAALQGNIPGESNSAKENRIMAQGYMRQGFSPEDSMQLALTDTTAVIRNALNTIDDEIKRMKPRNSWENADYGTKEDDYGNEVPITADEYKQSRYAQLIRGSLGGRISPEGLQKFIDLGYGAGLSRAKQQESSTSTSTIGGLSQESIDAITRALIEQYQ